MSKQTIDEILERYSYGYPSPEGKISKNEAKAALSALIDEVIGGDDETSVRELSREMDFDVASNMSGLHSHANDLRAEQRKRKEELLG